MAQGTSTKRFLTNSAKRASAGVLLALALAAFLLAGCGGGSSGTSSSAEGGSAGDGGGEATVAGMRLESPSVTPSSGDPGLLPVQYTCEGKRTSPALRWQGVPEGTAELVLFMMNLRPTQGTLVFDWAVAGISPKLDEIKAGQVPKGAAVGYNSFGMVHYELCPEGSGETYKIALFALPKKLSPSRGFDVLALHKEVTEISGNVGLLVVGTVR
jgi:phosphatidylethanolamine-binding protein (PEBP) family uncharacterized protein